MALRKQIAELLLNMLVVHGLSGALYGAAIGKMVGEQKTTEPAITQSKTDSKSELKLPPPSTVSKGSGKKNIVRMNKHTHNSAVAMRPVKKPAVQIPSGYIKVAESHEVRVIPLGYVRSCSPDAPSSCQAVNGCYAQPACY